MKPSREELVQLLVIEDLSYAVIGRQFSVTGAAVKKWAKNYMLPLPQRRTFTNGNASWQKRERLCKTCTLSIKGKGKQFCSHKCQHEHYYRSYIIRWKGGEEKGWRTHGAISEHIREYMFRKFNNKCCLCGWGLTNIYTSRVPLEVHHIDGDYKNNTEDNLQLLCPNCHSLTANYRSRQRTGQARIKGDRGRQS